MARIASSLLVVSLSFGAPLACSGSSEGGGAATPIPLDEIAKTVAETFCGELGPCCAAAGYAYDRAACEALLRSTYEQNLVAPARGGKVKYDASLAGSCVARAREALRACQVPDVDECERMFSGTVPHGGACADSAECEAPAGGDAFCDDSEGAGTCVSSPRGKAGDACDTTCTENGNVTSCSGSGGGGGEPPTGPVAECYTNDGVVCGPEGKCKALAPAGGACTDGVECEGRARCVDGTCGAPSAEGGACSYRDEECAGGLYCRDGTCAKELPLGSDCEDFVDVCAGGTCDEGKCVTGSDLVSSMLCGG